jgi:hypothetical protein
MAGFYDRSEWPTLVAIPPNLAQPLTLQWL